MTPYETSIWACKRLRDFLALVGLVLTAVGGYDFLFNVEVQAEPFPTSSGFPTRVPLRITNDSRLLTMKEGMGDCIVFTMDTPRVTFEDSTFSVTGADQTIAPGETAPIYCDIHNNAVVGFESPDPSQSGDFVVRLKYKLFLGRLQMRSFVSDTRFSVLRLEDKTRLVKVPMGDGLDRIPKIEGGG